MPAPVLNNKKLNNASGRWKQIIAFSIILAFLMSFFPSRKAEAWDAIPSVILEETLTEVRESLMATITTAIVIETMEFFLQETYSWLGLSYRMGVGFNSYITSWRDFLIKAPGEAAASGLEKIMYKASGGRSGKNYRSKRNNTCGYGCLFAKEGFDNSQKVYYGLIKSTRAAEIEINPSEMPVELAKSFDTGMRAYSEDVRAMLTYENDLEATGVDPAGIDEADTGDIFSGDNLGKYNAYIMGFQDPWTIANFYQQQWYSESDKTFQRKLVEAQMGGGRVSPTDDMNDYELMYDMQAEEWTKASSRINMLLFENGGAKIASTIVKATFARIYSTIRMGIRNIRQSYNRDMDVYRQKIYDKFMQQLNSTSPQKTFEDEMQDVRKRHSKYGVY